MVLHSHQIPLRPGQIWKGASMTGFIGHNLKSPQQIDPNRAYFRFQKMNPQSFKGGPEVMVSHFWLDSMEKIFRTLQCSEEEKVLFAAHMLEEDAQTWWTNAHELMVNQGTPVTWANFKEMFSGHFFPPVMKLSKQAEFINLRQGEMSVGEFTAKFERLSQFYQLAKHAPNDEWKMQMYKAGLRADVAQGLSSYAMTSYAGLVQQAYVAEADRSISNETMCHSNTYNFATTTTVQKS